MNDQAKLFRTLDAAANRCREGLRVLEDYVRFQRDDQQLSAALKQLRHHLQQYLNQLGEEHWIFHRNSTADVGPAAANSLEQPQSRCTTSDVLRANSKRVEEALRSLEEFSKLLDPAVASAFEKLRYTFYSVEQQIATPTRRPRLDDCRLYLLVTNELCPQGIEPLLKQVLGRGIDIVQLREKAITDRNFVELAHRVRDWTASAEVLFIINDRPDIAELVGADGVHLGQDDLSVAQARQLMSSDSLIGVSTHHLDQARAAILAGADYLGVGPVFPSRTKNFDQFPGLPYVQEVSQASSIPWYPLGGIDEENLESVLEAGASRAALSSVICRANDPGLVTERLAARLRNVIGP